MRGEDRDHEGVVEEVLQLRGGDAGLMRAGEGAGQRAGLGRPVGDGVAPHPADLVLILGDIRQVREVGIGAHDLHGLRRRQRF